MEDQFLIKVLLLGFIAAIGLMVLLPARGARRLALRRLTLLFLIALAAVAVLFPGLSNEVAKLVGVGRGADLLLYGLVVAFIGYAVTTRAHHYRVDVQITELTRAQAIAAAPKPGTRDSEVGS